MTPGAEGTQPGAEGTQPGAEGTQAGAEGAEGTDGAANKQRDHYAIRARKVRFEWEETPLHWVPDDPVTTHVVNVLHLLLPAGEKWFCHVYRQALPIIEDENLRADVKGFIGQEAVHSRAHAAVLEHLAAQGLDTSRYTRRIDLLFEKLLGDHRFGTGKAGQYAERRWLLTRLAVIAAIEHFTCILGTWIIEHSGELDRVGADPVMLDLLRWHGAEEVEHRAVAFDVQSYFSPGLGGYVRRAGAMLTVLPVLVWLWAVGSVFLIRHDPQIRRADRRKMGFGDFVRAGRSGLVPTTSFLLGSVPRFLRYGYHPSTEGSTDVALAYLAGSPAARYAAGGAGRD